MKKTDAKSNDVLMPMEIEDWDLLSTVNTFLNDETGEEAKSWSDDSQKRKILTILGRSQRSGEGTSERAQPTERTGCHDSCETI